MSVSRYLSKEAARSTRAPSSFNPSIARDAIEVCLVFQLYTQYFRLCLLTMGRACGLMSFSWFSHSVAMSAASSLCDFGISSLAPSGVRNGRPSSVTVRIPVGKFAVSSSHRSSIHTRALPLLSATSTVFQNRLSVTLAPRM